MFLEAFRHFDFHINSFNTLYFSNEMSKTKNFQIQRNYIGKSHNLGTWNEIWCEIVLFPTPRFAKKNIIRIARLCLSESGVFCVFSWSVSSSFSNCCSFMLIVQLLKASMGESTSTNSFSFRARISLSLFFHQLVYFLLLVPHRLISHNCSNLGNFINFDD